MPRLENWLMVQGFSPYMAPETQSGHLQGVVYGHDKHKDGKTIITSTLISFDLSSGLAQTRSGSQYSLGKPDPKWIEWLEENEQLEFVDDLKKLTSRILN